MVLLGRKTGDVKIRELRVNGVEVENAKKSCLKSGRPEVSLSKHDSQDAEIVAFIKTTD